MEIYDVIIVGSGAAGVWAAEALQGKKVLLLDVGIKPKVSYSEDLPSFSEIKAERGDLGQKLLLGEQLESLNNIFNDYLSPKLKSPMMRYIVDKPSSSQCQIHTKDFSAIQSFSKGGLANAWGAGCFRFNDQELATYPIKINELEPYYQKLTKEIGIAGTSDDLVPFFGSTEELLPPLSKSSGLNSIYNLYQKKRHKLNPKGLFFGHSRLAYQEDATKSLECFLSINPKIYTPALTLEKLEERKAITYLPGFLVSHFIENEKGVEVFTKNLSTNNYETFNGRNLILAMGTLNTTRCVLASLKDYETELPLVDNPIAMIPLINPFLFGMANRDKNIMGGLMNLILERNEQLPIQASLYNVGNILLSDLIMSLPLSAEVLPSAIRKIITGLFVAQVFYPQDCQPPSRLKLRRDGSLEINSQQKPGITQEERKLIKLLRELNLFSHPMLIQRPNPGNAIHYAGTIPMRQQPDKKYECDANGLLNHFKKVYLADASLFPELPAKNHTFTLMANAMRIAEQLKKKMG